MTKKIERNQFENLSEVIQRTQAGDSQAEMEVHKRFVARLVRLASSRINERFRAKIEPEEVFQSVFVSFFRRNQNGDFEFEDWNGMWALLVKITVNKCSRKIDRFLAAKRDVSREVVGKETSHNDSSVNLVSEEPSPEEIVVFQETLDNLLNRLPEPLQAIVCLRLQGLSNLEISEKLNRSERTVYRSLNQIRDLFMSLDQDNAE